MTSSFDRCLRDKKRTCVFSKSIQNQRDYQEDRLTVFWVNDYIVLAVCDGHGGERAAEYVNKEIRKRLVREKPEWKALDLASLLHAISHDWDQECLRRLKSKRYPQTIEERAQIFENRHGSYDRYGWASGTTCCVLAVSPLEKRLKAANIGDSRAAWQNGSTLSRISSTKQHHPNPRDLGHLGGKVIRDEDDTKRVAGDLSVGRVIGDNAEHLMGTMRHAADSYEKRVRFPFRAIVASDGIWDVVTPLEAFRFFTPTTLIQHSVKMGSEDNMTVISLEVNIAETEKPQKGKRRPKKQSASTGRRQRR